MNSGELVSSNTTLDTCCCVMSFFIQNNGDHTVQNRLQLQDFCSLRFTGRHSKRQ
jgi:hypothetical protein